MQSKYRALTEHNRRTDSSEGILSTEAEETQTDESPNQSERSP